MRRQCCERPAGATAALPRIPSAPLPAASASARRGSCTAAQLCASRSPLNQTTAVFSIVRDKRHQEVTIGMGRLNMRILQSFVTSSKAEFVSVLSPNAVYVLCIYIVVLTTDCDLAR